EIPLPGSPGCLTGALEPGMLVRGMVDHQLGDDPQPATMGFADEAAHVRHVAVIGVYPAIVCNVVTIVAPRRWIERQQPQGVDAQIHQVVEFLDKSGEVADTIVVGIEKGLHMQLVDDRILVPARVMEKYRSPALARHCSSLRPWAVYATFRTADARARCASTGSCRTNARYGRSSSPPPG